MREMKGKGGPMKRFYDFLGGMLFVELRGNSPERFFNVCRSRKIPLYEISTRVTDKGTLYVAKMKLQDYFLRTFGPKSLKYILLPDEDVPMAADAHVEYGANLDDIET